MLYSYIVHSAAGSLDRNVAKVNRMLQEMRVIAVDKQATQSKEEVELYKYCRRWVT